MSAMPLRELPGACPVCGGVTIAPATQRSTLLAVCDVLVLKPLERVGSHLLRSNRGENRFRILGARPKYLAHTLWPASDEVVEKSLRGAWDVVPALLDVHGCCNVTAVQVSGMLDDYVHDLVVTGTAHELEELCYRFEARLGLPVYDNAPADDDFAPLVVLASAAGRG